MPEFDTGSKWQEPEENVFGLTNEEIEIAKRIEKKMQEITSKYTFWMREHKAYPNKPMKIQFSASLKGDTLEKFQWLKFFAIDAGWHTSDQIVSAILEAGIQTCWAQQQVSIAGASLAAQSMQHLPPEIASQLIAGKFREAIQRQKEIEKQNEQDVLEGAQDA